MTKRGSADVAFFLLGGHDLLGTLTTFDDKRSALLERTDTLGDTYEEHSFVGVRMAEISQEGFFDDDLVTGHGVITTGPGIARVLCYGIAGTATGAEFVGWASAVEVGFTESAARGELHKAKANYRTGGPVETGRIVRTYRAAGSTGASTGTPLDNGASSSGVAGYLQYNATAGEANIRILDSADNITYATLFTFAKTASGFGAERQSVTTFAQRYVAVDVTTASATGSIADLNFFAGLVRGLTS